MTFPSLPLSRKQDVYESEWFIARQQSTRQSAEAILPYVLDLIRPRSVVDVGCGLGSWLAVAREHGVERVLGIDGDYVDRNSLEIPPEFFHPWDLRKPLLLGQTFDLALSLEVAEHLPAPNAPTFVRGLVELAPVVLFSAAVPFQGGTGHANEQWPAYWAQLFLDHEYIAVDSIRSRFWHDERVRYFYAQNAVLYVDRARLEDHARLLTEVKIGHELPQALVHPRLYLRALRRLPVAEDTSIGEIARLTIRALASPLLRSLDQHVWSRSGRGRA